MNVIAFNGSPRPNGNTQRLIEVVFEELRGEGIETRRIDICKHRPRGCIACMKCRENKDERCVLTDDPMNEWIQLAKAADGIIIASPTYFANVTSETKALIDRMGFVARGNGCLFRRKVGAAVVAVRRAGALPTFDAINHMLHLNEMILLGSTYWNLGIGMAPGDVETDEEGIANMRHLGQNMAWAIQKLNA